ncbi:hypothetical protein PORY_001729 [Pneumocystis oryctolagi]|uniref:Uncharacterized protein n=1 Tax=Pneumocystis oryctolagi TaxID=42067 RepID=A0ACB7CDV3_9ASCO|nr:hypothetical protein PORY_001729 [Pneumocystis oryctolagi]
MTQNKAVIPFTICNNWNVVFQDSISGAVVLFNRENKQLSLYRNVKNSLLVQKPNTFCPFCYRPFHTNNPRAIHDESSLMFRPLVNSEYFRFLEDFFWDDTERPVDVQPLSSSPTNSPNTESAPLSSMSFNQGYFKRFFIQEGSLGRGSRGEVLKVLHVLDGVPLGLENSKLTKFGPTVPVLYILQEYCDKGDLESYIKECFMINEPTFLDFKKKVKRLREKPFFMKSTNETILPLEMVTSFIKDIASGLSFLHENNLIHRDLKPGNCLLQSTKNCFYPRALVSDFGESQVATEVVSRSGGTGTLEYTAPEVLLIGEEGKPKGFFTSASDIFSLGLILHWLLFPGKLPYEHSAEEYDKLRCEIVNFKGYQYNFEKSNAPENLYRFLETMLSPDPYKRPSSHEIVEFITKISKEYIFQNIPENSQSFQFNKYEKSSRIMPIPSQENIAFSNTTYTFPWHGKTKTYADTLCLPRTGFSLRQTRHLQASDYLYASTQQLYEWQETHLPQKNRFILHDGPPYVNGTLHLGHALNKILKDIILRVNIMKGRGVVYIPGWDCHGLPIELKILEEHEWEKMYKHPEKVRKEARKYASKMIEYQKKEFKEFAIMANWEKSYRTMDLSYCINQIDIFKKMVEKGLIYRRRKPVYWSPSSKTALADAELIYKDDHTSHVVLVKFPLVDLGRLSLVVKSSKQIYALVWTTTPWTLPANRAIFIHKDIKYVIIDTVQYGSLIVAYDRLNHLSKSISISQVSSSFSGEELLKTTYCNPLDKNNKILSFYHAEYVTSESGTGLVHAAPGHGMEDYEVSIQHDIEIFSPVDDHGCFTKDVLNKELESLFVLGEGNKKVIELLDMKKMLVFSEKYIHKYPYDWRTKKPVIQRATAQWFLDIKKIKDQAIKVLENVKMVPKSGKTRLTSFIQSRSEWCISRQRVWGVPIPVLYNLENGEPLLTVESIDHIIKMIKKYGIDAWWENLESDIWVAPEYKKNNVKYKKGTETMDVWFDSGVSWNVVFNDYNDLIQGWFQSLLLTFISLQYNLNIAPYGTVLTHGHVLDQHNQKMSKSIGNVISPKDIIFGGKDIKKEPAYGVDVLRLWVAGSDFTSDINISSIVLKNVAEMQRKIRSTLRFLLGNLYDWTGDEVKYEDLKKIDQYALFQTYEFNFKIRELYDKFLFVQVVHAIANYTNNQLSSFYFDIVKDRLYADHSKSKSRISSQTVFFHIFRNYISMISPIIPLLALEAWKSAGKNIIGEIETPFHLGWYKCRDEWLNLKLKEDFRNIEIIRSASNLVLEKARKEKSSLESVIFIKVSVQTKTFDFLKKMEQELPELLIVSDVSIIPMNFDLPNKKWSIHEKIELLGDICHIIAQSSEKRKCLRCWMYTADIDVDLCVRCMKVINS